MDPRSCSLAPRATKSRERAEGELKAMATKLTAQLDAVSTCHRHRITPHTAAMLHPLTAAVPFTMLRLSYANLPCHNPHRATHPYQVSTLYTEPRRTQRDAAFGGGC